VWHISITHLDPDHARDAALTRHRMREKRPMAEVLVEGSSYSRGNLKRRLYADGLKERRCEVCGQDEAWRGRPMSLILDHINGVSNDNRLENLRIICPNCAATLDTHCGRLNKRKYSPRECHHCSAEFYPRARDQRYCCRRCAITAPRGRPQPERRKVERPPYTHLVREVRAMGYLATGRRYGVSDNAIRKWIRQYERERAAAPRGAGITPRPAGAVPQGSAAAVASSTSRSSPRTVPSPTPASTLSPVKGPTVIILAAGQGTRMRSTTPKVLHPLCGRAMLGWPIAAAREAGAGRIVVVGGPDGALADHLPAGIELAVQQEPRGTADAVLAAAGFIDPAADVLVLSGDAPLVTAELVRAIASAQSDADVAATLATTTLEDPSGYGRVVRGADGSIERVVETKAPGDATEEQLAIREVNAGMYAFAGQALLDALREVRSDNAQGEYYLPDVLAVLRAQGARVTAFEVPDPDLLMGVNDRVELAAARAVAQRRIHEDLMRSGVTIVDPATTVIEAGVQIGPDTVIEPSCFLRGTTRLGGGCRIGPLTTIIDSHLGDAVSVAHSYLVSCEVADAATVGPFAYLRPGAVLREGAKAGTFVEIKNSEIGRGAKVPHLSYVGDAEVGEDSNLGASTITANYDGRAKHRTHVGKRVHTGVDTTLVAPVTVGDDAYTGAGSVITRDVPPAALGIARPKQENVEGYAGRRRGEGSGPPPGDPDQTEPPAA
jgi:bifunctional UDP-N-acetylglucosamine pyrophosphorylase/glucosamine-1-phosphate N-acetyltransferase